MTIYRHPEGFSLVFWFGRHAVLEISRYNGKWWGGRP